MHPPGVRLVLSIQSRLRGLANFLDLSRLSVCLGKKFCGKSTRSPVLGNSASTDARVLVPTSLHIRYPSPSCSVDRDRNAIDVHRGVLSSGIERGSLWEQQWIKLFFTRLISPPRLLVGDSCRNLCHTLLSWLRTVTLLKLL